MPHMMPYSMSGGLCHVYIHFPLGDVGKFGAIWDEFGVKQFTRVPLAVLPAPYTSTIYPCTYYNQIGPRAPSSEHFGDSNHI